MKLLLLAALLLSSRGVAQTFTLGTPSDPCTGGATWDVPNAPIATLRYGSSPISCTFAAPGGAGAYIVEVDFVEPSAYVPASDPSGRLFNVTVTDAWGTQTYGSLTNVDLFTQGATSPVVVIARSFLVFSVDGRVKVTLSTVKRSAVISQVKITPATLLLLQDTTAATKLILDSDVATVCAMPSTPPNCTVNNCGSATGSVSCGAPLMQTLAGIWAVKL